jgi:glycosyltransferase involved in cell wall biosynthesis
LKIAIVHDALCVSGGAERFVLWLAKAFPDAPIFTSLYLPDSTFPEFKDLKINSLMTGGPIKTERQFKLLYPYWLWKFRQLDFSAYDIVLSSSTYLAKFINTRQPTRHYGYLYAPFRLLWRPESYTRASLPTPGPLAPIIKKAVPYFRNWDIKNTQRLDKIATSCQNIATQIETIYKTKPTIIHPPVSLKDYSLATTEGAYYLTVSRLVYHKRIDVAIEACNRLQRPLIVVGDGPERQSLERIAGETIQFVGRVDDVHLRNLYLNAKALLFPSYEDYGLVPLESQASGRPVLAFGAGGALETVLENETGLFFPRQDAESLAICILAFENRDFDPVRIRSWVNQFDETNYFKKIFNFMGMDQE